MDKHREVLHLAGQRWRGGDGEADGVSKFVSEEQAKRVQEEFVPIARFVEKASQLLDDVGKKHGFFIALLKAQKAGKLLAPFLLQTPPCPCSGFRKLVESITICNATVPFCDNCAIDITAKGFEEISYSQLHFFLPDLVEYLHVRCPCSSGEDARVDPADAHKA